MSADFDDVCTLAQNLARNRDWSVFPCRDDKSPAISGKGGFKHAQTDQFAVAELWRRHPGPLVGVACGWRSSIAVLDCDVYEPKAAEWFSNHQHKLPRTLTYETRQGGYHLYYEHQPGLRSSNGSIAPGVDVKAAGGYAISWWCAGFGCLDYRPLAPWPEWLSQERHPPRPTTLAELSAPAKPADNVDQLYRRRVETFVGRILANIERAPDGAKHDTLLRSARTIGGVIEDAGITPTEVQHMIIEALKRNRSAVRDWPNAFRTIRDGLAAGVASPFRLEDRPYAREAA